MPPLSGSVCAASFSNDRETNVDKHNDTFGMKRLFIFIFCVSEEENKEREWKETRKDKREFQKGKNEKIKAIQKIENCFLFFTTFFMNH